MDDLISRQHFDERVRLAGGMADEELTQDFKDGVLTVLEMLKTEPHVNPNAWIPVTERLPESSGVYIVTREFNDGFECADLTDACYFDGSIWYGDNRINHKREYVYKKIKAWMPLPEPWRGEE